MLQHSRHKLRNMGEFAQYLTECGYVGMFLASFLAGSFIPFSSELVMGALQLAGLSVVQLLIWGTLGNTLGSCFNYWLGHLGNMHLIEKYAHVRHEKIEKSQSFVHKYGPIMGLFAWIPILGSAITISLGLLRSNFWWTLLAILTGKVIRYAFVLFVVSGI